MLSKTKYTIQNSIHLLIIITLKYVCRWIKKIFEKTENSCAQAVDLLDFYEIVSLSYPQRIGTTDTFGTGGAHHGNASKNSRSSHSRYKRSTVSSHKELVCGQISLPPQGRCPWLPHCKDFPVSPQSPHSSLRKKAQPPDRVTTDVQALSHSVAVIFHSQSVCRI